MLKKFLIFTILIISFIIFFYSTYKSEIVFDGQRREFYIIYIILSLTGIIFGWLLKYAKNYHITYLLICLFELYRRFIHLNFIFHI